MDHFQAWSGYFQPCQWPAHRSDGYTELNNFCTMAIVAQSIVKQHWCVHHVPKYEMPSLPNRRWNFPHCRPVRETPYARGRSWSLLHALHPSPLRSCLLPLRTLRPLQWFSPQRHVPLQPRSTVQLTLGKHTNFQEPKITNILIFGNYLFVHFGMFFWICFSARFSCYLQHFGAGSCHFNRICNYLQHFGVGTFIFHCVCNILVLKLVHVAWYFATRVHLRLVYGCFRVYIGLVLGLV